MKIDKGTVTNQANALSQPAPGKPGKEALLTKEKTDLSDTVELSGRNADVATLIEKVKETPSIRQDKVDSIKAAVENGTYKIDSAEIARAILRNNLLDEMFYSD